MRDDALALDFLKMMFSVGDLGVLRGGGAAEWSKLMSNYL
jgi:hypothetical protein